MPYIVVGLFLIASVPLVYWGVTFLQKYEVSKFLVSKAVAYQVATTDHTRTLLVLGDSTGVGVGAILPEDSVAGRLALSMQATYVENRAVSGAMVADIAGQIQEASLSHYDTVLIQIGTNDIVHFHSAQATADALLPSMQKAMSMAGTVILMSAGNVGAVTNFPEPIRPFHTRLNLEYHAAFAAMAAKVGATYVNLYASPEEDLFEMEPEVYLAPDGFHPSSEGYGLWFKRLQDTVR